MVGHCGDQWMQWWWWWWCWLRFVLSGESHTLFQLPSELRFRRGSFPVVVQPTDVRAAVGRSVPWMTAVAFQDRLCVLGLSDRYTMHPSGVGWPHDALLSSRMFGWQVNTVLDTTVDETLTISFWPTELVARFYWRGPLVPRRGTLSARTVVSRNGSAKSTTRRPSVSRLLRTSRPFREDLSALTHHVSANLRRHVWVKSQAPCIQWSTGKT